MTGKKLLLVEDNEDLALLWEKYFSSAGFDVTVCRNGTSALEKFEVGKFALVASDFVLPDITGTDILDRVRELDSRIPFLLLTGMREQAISDHVAKAGNAIVVFKPVGFKDLLGRVKEILED